MTILVKAVTIILCGADVNSGPLLDSAFTILLAVLYTIGLWRILERSSIRPIFLRQISSRLYKALPIHGGKMRVAY